jgi:hypothetical protein
MKPSFEEWLEEWSIIRANCDKDAMHDALLEAGQSIPSTENFDPYSTLDRLMKHLGRLDQFLSIELPLSARRKKELLELRKDVDEKLSNQERIRLRARTRSLKSQFVDLTNLKDVDEAIVVWQKRLDTAKMQLIPGLIEDFKLTIQVLSELRDALDK